MIYNVTVNDFGKTRDWKDKATLMCYDHVPWDIIVIVRLYSHWFENVHAGAFV